MKSPVYSYDLYATKGKDNKWITTCTSNDLAYILAKPEYTVRIAQLLHAGYRLWFDRDL